MSYRGFHDRRSIQQRVVFGPAAVPWIMAAAAAMQAISSIQQGQASRKAANYQAALAENNAVVAQQQAAFNESREREKARHLLSAQRARAAAGGILADEGSPLFTSLDAGEDAEIAALNIRRGGQLRADESRAAAALDRYRGRSAEQASYFRAGSSLLDGLSKVV